jgi:hypothetical protein
MKITLSDPILVAEGPAGETRWGRYQFPTFGRIGNRIALTFHVAEDSARAYGQIGEQPNRGLSSDGGRTWSLVRATEPTDGLLLPNGDHIRIGIPEVTPKSIPVGELTLPAPVGTLIGTYGQLPYTYYRHDELPLILQGVPLSRRPAGSDRWVEERARLDDPAMQRYTIQEVFPVVWWGDVHLTTDGSLLAIVYPCSAEGEVACYRSRDFARSWQPQGRILYRPDLKADPLAAGRTWGFTEPGTVILRDGSLLAALRTTDGLGVGPMYLTRSKDLGRSWPAPHVMSPTGVMPRLLQLGNGVIVLSSGRPGVDLRFSFDHRGETWTEPHALVPLTSDDVQADSCGYTSLIALDDDSFLVAYSWFKRPGTDGQTHKAVLVRRVTVRP